MCLGVPGRIAEIWEPSGAWTAHVEFPRQGHGVVTTPSDVLPPTEAS